MSLYIAYNGVEPTIAKRVAVTTGTAIKTLLQVATPATREITVVAWGIDFDGSAAAVPGSVELIEADVAATVTSVTPTKFDNPSGLISQCPGGTALTGHTATVEGTIAAVRSLDSHLIAPTNQYKWEFSLSREPRIAVSKFLRVRVHFAAAVNAVTWILWSE